MKLNNKTVVKSISYINEEIIQNILSLYVPDNRFDYDPTYSKGNFYKSNIQKPILKSDVNTKYKDNLDFICSSENIPLQSETINSIMFDPPFVMGSGPSVLNPNKGSNIINERFGIFKNNFELFNFYCNSLKEFHRILKNNGVLVFKCQDCVFSAKQVLSHVFIINKAQELGFYAKDIFILLAKNRVLSGKVKKQQHARKFHSYFIVFIKTKLKISYL